MEHAFLTARKLVFSFIRTGDSHLTLRLKLDNLPLICKYVSELLLQ